ncbi:MAG: tetratricopeptide repeat protein [Saprospiraceae bacterium]|nr:tetratricopeptide repeat protein [Saprospiraceae bacterium]
MDAETAYRKADGEKSSVKSAYNLGNSLMKQNRYDEAITKYNDAAAKQILIVKKPISTSIKEMLITIKRSTNKA